MVQTCEEFKRGKLMKKLSHQQKPQESLQNGQISKFKGFAGEPPERLPPPNPCLVSSSNHFPAVLGLELSSWPQAPFSKTHRALHGHLDTGPVGAMADCPGVNISLVTPKAPERAGVGCCPGKAETQGPQLSVSTRGGGRRGHACVMAPLPSHTHSSCL